MRGWASNATRTPELRPATAPQFDARLRPGNRWPDTLYGKYNRRRYIELLVVHDSGEHDGDQHVKNRADQKRAEMILDEIRGRLRKDGGDVNSQITEQLREISGPSDGYRGTANDILQEQIPADDPGDEFSQGGIGVGISAPGHWKQRCKFGVAKGGTKAAQRRDNE